MPGDDQRAAEKLIELLRGQGKIRQTIRGIELQDDSGNWQEVRNASVPISEQVARIRRVRPKPGGLTVFWNAQNLGASAFYHHVLSYRVNGVDFTNSFPASTGSPLDQTLRYQASETYSRRATALNVEMRSKTGFFCTGEDPPFFGDYPITRDALLWIMVVSPNPVRVRVRGTCTINGFEEGKMIVYQTHLLSSYAASRPQETPILYAMNPYFSELDLPPDATENPFDFGGTVGFGVAKITDLPSGACGVADVNYDGRFTTILPPVNPVYVQGVVLLGVLFRAGFYFGQGIGFNTRISFNE